jgi:hypothetical protein
LGYFRIKLYDLPNQPQKLEVKSEEEVDADEKGPYILPSKGGKAVKEMRDKATGDNGVPGDVLQLLGGDSLRLITQLINNIHETGKCCKDFIEVTRIALKKGPEATKCSDHCPITAHTAKTVAWILQRIIRKTEVVLGEDQFGFRKGKGTGDATGMLRTLAD